MTVKSKDYIWFKFLIRFIFWEERNIKWEYWFSSSSQMLAKKHCQYSILRIKPSQWTFWVNKSNLIISSDWALVRQGWLFRISLFQDDKKGLYSAFSSDIYYLPFCPFPLHLSAAEFVYLNYLSKLCKNSHRNTEWNIFMPKHIQAK